MEKRKRIIFCLTSLILVAVWSLVFTPSAIAGDWKLGQGEGECYKGNSRKGGAKYCHNCKSQGGNKVKWVFDVTCDKKPAGKIEVELACKKKVPDEGKQLRQLQAAAKKSLPKSSVDCKELK